MSDMFLKMVDNPLPYGLAISLLGIYEIKWPEKYKSIKNVYTINIEYLPILFKTRNNPNIHKVFCG